jgi:TonB family protein
MPSSETPTDVAEPNGPAETILDTSREAESPELAGPACHASDQVSALRASPGTPGAEPLEPEQGPPVVRGSRWVDYNTHELLEMIGELEDERRWARLREGVWIAILIHLALLSAITWIPKYIFKVPLVVDQNNAIKQHKDFTYLDTPMLPPKVAIKPLTEKPPVIDKKTLEEMNRATPPPAPAPAPQPAPPAPVQPPPPIPPVQQSQLEAPRPAPVPARPNFAMNSQNPADQLREAMKGAAQNPGTGGLGNLPPGGLARHPGAGTGGLDILSDTQGVDFSNWLQRWYYETRRTWDPLIPDEVNAPIMKQGQVQIRFKVLPNGRVTDMQLEGRSGDTGLDRAAWGAIQFSNYPPLPREFHGPYLELRALFMYNMEPR